MIPKDKNKTFSKGQNSKFKGRKKILLLQPLQKTKTSKNKQTN